MADSCRLKLTYPELRLVPVLGESIHRQGLTLSGILLGGLLQPGELVGVGVPLGVELLECAEGMRGEGAFD